jgi:hypothetical protein
MKIEDTDVVRAQVLYDGHNWGLYLVPLGPEICITEAELREALAIIDEAKP